MQKSLVHFFTNLTTGNALTLLILVSFFVFANMLGNGFVGDDFSYIIQNTQVHTLNFGTIFGPSYYNLSFDGYYRPLPALFSSLLFVSLHDTAFPYHFFQSLLHTTNGILLFFLFKKFFHKNLALLLVLVFLVHPIQVESVSYIAQVVSPLFFFFGITALLVCMKPHLGTRRLALVMLLLFLSLLTKETGILFFVLVPATRLFYEKKHIKRLVLFLLIPLSIYFLIRFGIGHVYFVTSQDDTPIATLNLLSRIENMPLILFTYLRTFFYPVTLVSDQKWIITQLTISTFYLPLFIDLLFLVILLYPGQSIYGYNKKLFPSYVFFFLWFTLGMAMHLQFFPLDMTIADHWMYLPLAGLLGIIGVICQAYPLKNKQLKAVLTLFALLVILLFSLRTMVRNTNWHDDLTLNLHDSNILTNGDIENNIGSDYENKNEFTKALPYFIQSDRLFPTELSLQNTATTYQEIGDMQQAGRYYALATQAHAVSLFENNSFSETEAFLKGATVSYPNNFILWKLSALTEFALHHTPDATRAAKIAKALHPHDSDINNLLAHRSFTILLGTTTYQFDKNTLTVTKQF